MRWHSEVLTKSNNLELVNQMLRRSYRVTGQDDPKDIETTRQIHLMYMLLNTLFLDWNYCRTYPSRRFLWRRDMSSFTKTVKGSLKAISEHPDEKYRYIINDFENIFFDFPPEFLRALRKEMGGVTAPYRPHGTPPPPQDSLSDQRSNQHASAPERVTAQR